MILGLLHYPGAVAAGYAKMCVEVMVNEHTNRKPFRRILAAVLASGAGEMLSSKSYIRTSDFVCRDF